jgi:calmodulin
MELTPDYRANIPEAFKLFDRNADGNLTGPEITMALNALGQYPSPEEFSRLVKGKDALTLPEFTSVVESRIKELDSEEQLIASFKVWDKKGTGFVSAEEMRTALVKFGVEPLSQLELDELIKDAKVDDRGMIDYVRLVKLMLSS